MIRPPMPPDPGMSAAQAAEREGAALAIACLSSLMMATSREQRAHAILNTVRDLQRATCRDTVAAGFSRTLAAGLEIAMADEVSQADGTVSFGVSAQQELAARAKTAEAIQTMGRGSKRARR